MFEVNNMRKRTLLRWTGAAAGGLTAPMLAGCQSDGRTAEPANRTEPGNRTESEGDSESENDTDAVAWRKELVGGVERVTDGRVFGTEVPIDAFIDEERLFALDVESGERLWTSEESGLGGFAPLAVEDGVYAGWGSDQIGGGHGQVHAFELDGTNRWAAETGGVYDRPRIADETVYVSGDDGIVRALRTDDGELRWKIAVLDTEDGFFPIPSIIAIDDEIYVAARQLLALDPQTGEPQWRYGDAEIRDATISDGVAYLTDAEEAVAVANGNEVWRQRVGENRSVRAVVGERVILAHESELAALDTGTGDAKWTVELTGGSASAITDEIVYRSTETDDRTITAYDLTDGTQRWDERLDGGSVLAIEIAPETADVAVWVVTTRRLYGVTAEGRIPRSVPLSGSPASFAIDGTDRVVVESEDEVYAVDIE